MNKEQKIQELSDEIDRLKKELEKLQKKPYKISYPKHGTKVYFISDFNGEIRIKRYDVLDNGDKNLYEIGLYFQTEQQAEQFKRERALIKKIKCWAKEQQGDWQPDWSDFNEEKWRIQFSAGARVFSDIENKYYMSFTFFPIFKTKEIAEACGYEFGDEILEVFC